MNRRPCRWPGCKVQVPARMWGCKRHWYTLPHKIRDAIWAAYRPGQEIDLEISEEYEKAEGAAQEWIARVGSTMLK